MNLFLLLLLLLHLATLAAPAAASGGRWALLQRSIGVSAMHMQLLRNDRVVIFDRTDFGRSNLSLPDGRCRDDPSDRALTLDCTAHSVEYSVPSNTFRPLTVLTDTWCSSATVDQAGRLVQTGGFNDGERVVRTFAPCDDSACDWEELPGALTVRRWYATNQILPDGRAIVVGGRRQFNYEFFPKSSSVSATNPVGLSLLRQTNDAGEENNLYPFVFLSVDGNLFIFANNRAILFDYRNNTVVRTYPDIPGGEPRNYPSSGSAVLLPLRPPWTAAEVLICGGAPKGSYTNANRNKVFNSALNTCGRLRITDSAPACAMDTMPSARVMGDMVMLPTGKVLIVNGAGKGTAGWELGQDPVLNPVLYSPDSPAGNRFAVQNPTTVPRLYHSTAILLRDGRVLVGGSNPHAYYNFSGVQYPTDLSLEAFSPDYLSSAYSGFRPRITSPGSAAEAKYGEQLVLRFSVGTFVEKSLQVTMVAPAFATHSLSMNQRLLVLESKVSAAAAGEYEVAAVAPPTGALAPGGWYMVFVVNGGIPSEGILTVTLKILICCYV